MFNDTQMESAGDHIASEITHASLHTTGAVSSSADESTAARVAISWTVDTDGTMTAGPLNFTGGASEGPVARVGYWTASSAGSYRGGALLTGDNAFNVDGEYTVDSITETASAS